MLLACLVSAPLLHAVPITGANGTTVDFAGVHAATPEGLQVKIRADGDLATVPWDKFDLQKLQTEQADIFAAYQKAMAGETVGLYLGVSAADKPEGMTKPSPRPTQELFVQTEVRGKSGSGFSRMIVAMRRPSPNAKAIFLGGFGDAGGAELFSSIYIARSSRSSWDDLLATNHLVPVGLRVEYSGEDPRKEPFFLVDKGSGDAILEAIKTLANQVGRPDLAEAPLVIYGRELMGSAFAYNMAQWKPERVACALAMKGGAFFSIEPTEASVKVPLLILKGEYDDSWRQWELEPTEDDQGGRIDPPHEAANRFRSTVAMRPNWTLTVEPRGTSDFSPMTEMLGRSFIDAVIAQRFGGGTFADMHPDIAYLGNLEEKSVKNMPDDLIELGPEQTWLPDQKFGSVWRQFLEGTLEPPPPPRP